MGAGSELYELLVDLKLRSCLSSKDVCALAYWAAMAGAKGRVNKLAKQPGSGHSSEFFDRVTGLKQAEDE